MMRKVLLSIPPALSTLLFCAHLLYHGVPLAAAAAPLGALVLLAAKGAGAARLLAQTAAGSLRIYSDGGMRQTSLFQSICCPR